MKADLDMLVMRLVMEKEGMVLPPANCSEYLIDHVFLPLLRGESVSFNAIDYTAFDQNDVRDLFEYNESVSRAAQALGQMIQRVETIAPIARSVRQYC